MTAIERLLGGTFWIVIRWLLAGVFIYAGWVKLVEVQSFADSIARFRIVPEGVIHLMALGLPPFEMFCGIALIVGPWKRQAAFSVALLCLIFLGALLAAAARGIEVECTCFGSSSPEPLWRSIARDIALSIAAAGSYLSALVRRRCAQDELTTQTAVLNGTY